MTVATKSNFLRIPRITWVELHENKRTHCFTRNSSYDHRPKIRSKGNLCDFPHRPISSHVRGSLWYERIYTNCHDTQSNTNAAFVIVVSSVAFLVVLCINRPLAVVAAYHTAIKDSIDVCNPKTQFYSQRR